MSSVALPAPPCCCCSCRPTRRPRRLAEGYLPQCRMILMYAAGLSCTCTLGAEVEEAGAIFYRRDGGRAASGLTCACCLLMGLGRPRPRTEDLCRCSPLNGPMRDSRGVVSAPLKGARGGVPFSNCRGVLTAMYMTSTAVAGAACRNSDPRPILPNMGPNK